MSKKTGSDEALDEKPTRPANVSGEHAATRGGDPLTTSKVRRREVAPLVSSPPDASEWENATPTHKPAPMARDAVPYLTRTMSEVALLPLGTKAVFLLTRIDGASSVQSLIDLGVVPEADLLALLEQLLLLDAIGLK